MLCNAISNVIWKINLQFYGRGTSHTSLTWVHEYSWEKMKGKESWESRQEELGANYAGKLRQDSLGQATVMPWIKCDLKTVYWWPLKCNPISRIRNFRALSDHLNWQLVTSWHNAVWRVQLEITQGECFILSKGFTLTYNIIFWSSGGGSVRPKPWERCLWSGIHCAHRRLHKPPSAQGCRKAQQEVKPLI